MTVYLIRHGQSCANAGDKTIIDPPLTLLGREQAAAINLTVDLVICSPMRRALETYHYSNIISPLYIIINELRERICDIGDTMLLEEYTPENDRDFHLRIQTLADYLLKYNNQYGNIAVVCHGCIISSLTGVKPNNGEIIIADKDVLLKIVAGSIINAPCCSVSW